jgi:hypothetical protein
MTATTGNRGTERVLRRPLGGVSGIVGDTPAGSRRDPGCIVRISGKPGMPTAALTERSVARSAAAFSAAHAVAVVIGNLRGGR